MKTKTPPTISIIIPAYNAEKTVTTAVQSLLAQTFTDFEAIIIEDGSTDQTRAILKELEASEPRIKVVYKDTNEGLSAGRNSGMERARGTYIGFLDADDWMEADLLEQIYQQGIRKDADLILCGYSHDTMDPQRTQVKISRQVTMPSSFLVEKQEIVRYAAHCDTHKMFAYTWNKFYRRSLIEKGQLKFSSQTLIEDFLFNCQFWEQISRLSIVDTTKYHYVKASSEALTQKFLSDYYEIMEQRYQAIRNLAVSHSVFQDEIREQICSIFIKHLIAGMARDCSPKSGYSIKIRRNRIRKLLKTPSVRECRTWAKASNRQERLCNFVFKSNSVLLNLLTASLLYRMQTRSNAFDRLK